MSVAGRDKLEVESEVFMLMRTFKSQILPKASVRVEVTVVGDWVSCTEGAVGEAKRQVCVLIEVLIDTSQEHKKFKTMCVHTYNRLPLLPPIVLYKYPYMLVSAAVMVRFRFLFYFPSHTYS